MIYPGDFAGGVQWSISGTRRWVELIVLKLKIREAAGTVNALIGSIMCTGTMSQSYCTEGSRRNKLNSTSHEVKHVLTCRE